MPATSWEGTGQAVGTRRELLGRCKGLGSVDRCRALGSSCIDHGVQQRRQNRTALLREDIVLYRAMIIEHSREVER